MRNMLHLALIGAAVLGLAGTIQAGDRETALAVIDQAIKAHGGEKALIKAQTAIRSDKGNLILGAAVTPFTDEVIFGLPGRFKNTVKLEKGNQVIIVLNKDRAWRANGGTVFEVAKDGLEELSEAAYVDWIATLVPLKQDGFTLTPIAGKMVDGKPTNGIQASSKGHFDARIYFDKDSGLLVRIEGQLKEGGLKIEKSFVFAGYKDFDGVKLPTKRTELINGRIIGDVKEATYKFPAKVDEAAFNRP